MKIKFSLLLLLLFTLAACTQSPGSIIGETAEPLQQKEGNPVLNTYAEEILGITEAVKTTTDQMKLDGISDVLTPDFNRLITQSPLKFRGRWSGGMGFVGLGAETGELPIPKAISSNSGAIFIATPERPYPADAEAARALINEIYPNLEAVATHFLGVEEEFVFYQNHNESYTLGNGSIGLKNEIIMMGVAPGIDPQHPMVWVMIASGPLSEIFR